MVFLRYVYKLLMFSVLRNAAFRIVKDGLWLPERWPFALRFAVSCILPV